MKKYFVCSDVHSFFDILQKALEKKGFDRDNKEHILIVCGDLFDRGKQAKELLEYLTQLKEENRLILIAGNHEWLMEDLLYELEWHQNPSYHHYTNGTIDTLAQLTGTDAFDILGGFYNFDEIWLDLEKYHNLVWDCKNYYEIGNYIFVHGWIPHIRDYNELKEVSEEGWEKASWSNGMEEWHNGWIFKGKTIVCGHWHTSFGNYRYHGKGSGEFEKDSDFGIFEDEGIIALDACTAHSKKMNILVINEDEIG